MASDQDTEEHASDQDTRRLGQEKSGLVARPRLLLVDDSKSVDRPKSAARSELTSPRQCKFEDARHVREEMWHRCG